VLHQLVVVPQDRQRRLECAESGWTSHYVLSEATDVRRGRGKIVIVDGHPAVRAAGSDLQNPVISRPWLSFIVFDKHASLDMQVLRHVVPMRGDQRDLNGR